MMRFQRKLHNLSIPCHYIDQSLIQVMQPHTDLGILVDSDLKFHKYVTFTVCKAAGLTQNLLKSSVCRSPDFMLTLFSTYVRPIIECCSCIWHTGYIGDWRLLKSAKCCWTKCISRLGNLDYGLCLMVLNQYSIKGRLLHADLMECWKVLHGKCCIDASDLFILPPQTGMRGTRFKIGHS